MTLNRLLTRSYAVLAWLVALLASLHMATTWRLTSASAFTRVWFFGAGIAMAQAAALNLLHRTYGRSAVSLAWVTRGFNAVMLVFATIAGLVTGASVGELVTMIAALGALLVLSFLDRANRPRDLSA